MEDLQIVQMFTDRAPDAIKQLADKYGRYCNAVAYNILYNASDAEECVNDTYLRVWNSIPPNKPNSLKAFAGKIARNLAIDRLDMQKAQKRGGGQAALALEELSEIVGVHSDPFEGLALEELKAVLNKYLAGLPQEKRIIFMRRYWYMDSVKDIARHFGKTESAVKTMLFRIREDLRKELMKEGIDI
jgi:RNA polymerase sigma factor (sigma-70 family)